MLASVLAILFCRFEILETVIEDFKSKVKGKQHSPEVGKLLPVRAFCAARRAVTPTQIVHIWSLC